MLNLDDNPQLSAVISNASTAPRMRGGWRQSTAPASAGAEPHIERQASGGLLIIAIGRGVLDQRRLRLHAAHYRPPCWHRARRSPG